MPEQIIKIIFVNKTSIELADNEKISLWECGPFGSVSIEKGSICLIGDWQMSLIGRFLGSGLLGYIFIRPFLVNARKELLTAENIDRVIIVRRYSDTKIYHIFQKRDAGLSEVHVFKAGIESDETAIDDLIASIIPKERIQTESDFKLHAMIHEGKINEKDVAQLKKLFSEKSTSELKTIYAKRDTDEYRMAAIEATRRVLIERGESLVAEQ